MFPLNLTFGTAEIGFDVRAMLAREFGAYVASAREITYDNRFIAPRRKAPPRSRVVVYVRDGELIADGIPRERDKVFVVPEELVVPDGAPPVVLRLRGATLQIVCLRLLGDPRPDDERQRIVEYSVEKSTLDRLVDLQRVVEAGSDDAAPFVDALRLALLALAGDGVLPEEPEWRESTFGREEVDVPRAALAMFPALSNLAERPMMVDLIDRAGIAERQMRRDIRRAQEEFTLLDDGWRHAVVRWRVTAAALFLSSEKLALREVPKIAGYASLTAMAQAFRDAGLPSPTEVRRALTSNTPPQSG